MPLTFLIAGNPDTQFVSRVKVALAKACPAVQNEAGGTANHTLRVALVGRILANPDGYAQRFAPLVAVDNAIFTGNASLSAASDGQIEAAVNSLLDMFAVNGA